MEINVNLSKNLTLTGICENNEEDGKLIAVECFFNFFNEEGSAYVVIENLEDEYPRYAMTEISSELSDSFNDLLEREDYWNKIVEEIKKYIEFWTDMNTYDED